MLNFVLYATATLIWGSTWLGIKLQLSQVPPILSVGYRFFLASFILLVFCLITNKKLAFSRRDHLFLAIQGFSLFGSVVAFGCYMLLIGRIGADYAAYVMLLMPLVALILSTFFESYHWSASGVFGIAVVLLGNLIILTPAHTLEKTLGHILKN